MLARETFRAGLVGADVVADVGAHIGFYSLLAARDAPSAVVYAFEPDPYNAAALRVNVARARATAVKVVERAVSDEVGRATFRQSEATIGSSLVGEPFGPSREIHVETTTLDDELGDLAGRRLLLKIDVEGAERAALRGSVGALRGARSVAAIVELNPRALGAAGTGQDDLVGDLAAAGLEVRYLDERSHGVVPVSASLPKGNLFATRAS